MFSNDELQDVLYLNQHPSTVILSSNEDSDSLAINDKLRNAKGLEENKKIVFLIDNLLDYLG